MKKGRDVGSVGWCILSLALVGCSGGDLSGGVPGGGQNTGNSDAPGAGTAERKPNVIAGVKLAHVDITATHAVEFWETQPGNVMMIQSWDTAAGEQKLELESQLQSAGGKYGGLYRQLLNDPNAELSPELIAADERRAHLPIRDASQPLPARPDAPLPPAASGTQVPASAPVLPVAKPGEVQTQGVNHIGGGIATFVDPSWCSWGSADGGWCPPGAYNGWANGNVQETIYWDAVGHNPQATGGGWDYMNVNQWMPNSDGSWSWHSVFYYGLAPGHSVEAYVSSTATYYQGSITGNTVSYAELWRLSFPQLTYAQTWPLWTQNGFGNDINGITHDGSRWILSRTDNGPLVGGDSYGVLGRQDFVNNLQNSGPDRYNLGEPAAWVSAHYNHYGDIVYDPLTQLIFISLNKDGGLNAAIGAVNPADSFRIVGQASVIGTDNGQHDCPWLALNPKNRVFYTTEHNLPVLHQNLIGFPNGITRGGGLSTVALGDIHLVNPLGLVVSGSTPGTSVVNTGGGKVSSHGKLWMYAAPWDDVPEILGIDPYSGIIQVRQFVPVPAGGGFTSVEAEGLDVTEVDPHAPGISGQIHAQILGNHAFSDDAWSLVNYNVSDLSRL